MKKILINVNEDLVGTVARFKYLQEYYKDKTIRFLGWCQDRCVIEIDSETYYFYPMLLDKMMIKKTNLNKKRIIIIQRKKSIYDELQI